MFEQFSEKQYTSPHPHVHATEGFNTHPFTPHERTLSQHVQKEAFEKSDKTPHVGHVS
jgi:hypothetical protein